MATRHLRIGELAEQLKLPVETIRYYEREGLMPAPQRTGGNYRVYDAGLVERLAFIRNCRALDMTLDEIRELLRLRQASGPDCAGVNAVLDAHIEHVGERIAELRRLKTQLHTLRDRCVQASTIDACEILSGLSAAAPSPAMPARQHLPVHAGKAARSRRA
ncbi:MAG: Cd(II)/Pb(II)-responsive transcriptional regulator [Solimonas sp.]